jgi:glycosyltransferase involved in cell wall biosynthesis
VRVLVLTYETPAYPAGGGPSRQHSLLEPLAARHDIRVLSTGGPPRFGRPPEGVDLRLIDPGPEWQPAVEPWLKKTIRHYRGSDPWVHGPAWHHRAALGRELPGELAAFAPDLLVVEHGELGPLLHQVPPTIPSVFVLHNVLSSVQVQKIRAAGPAGSVNALLEVAVIARRERADALRATRVVVVSASDARRVRLLARGARIAVVPNCVNVEYFRRQGSRADHPVIVMTASYQYPPNQDAVAELVDTVFPIVRQAVPDAELVFVGQQMPESLMKRAESKPGVRVPGEVDDVRPELDRSWIAVAPLRKGSGSPLKVIEALAAGVPVAVTPRVARALGLAGEDDGIAIAETPSELGATIAALLSDRPRLDRAAAAGEVTARTRFDRVQAAAQLERVWFEARREHAC